MTLEKVAPRTCIHGLVFTDSTLIVDWNCIMFIDIGSHRIAS